MVRFGQTARLGVVLAIAGAALGEEKRTGFEGDKVPADWTVSGPVSVDASRDRAGGAGGAMKIAPGGKAVWKLRDADASGSADLWIHEDMTVPADPKTRRVGPRWGLVQADGRVLVVGTIYAPYLAGNTTYATSDSDQKAWFNVQYLGECKRQAGWHRWTFTLDAEKGLSIAVDGKDVNSRCQRFDWNKTNLAGMVGVAIFGDSGPAPGQTLWVDDVSVTLAGPMKAKPVPPPPPPPVVPDKDPPEAEPVGLVESVRGKHPRLVFAAEDVAGMRAFAKGEGKALMEGLERYLPSCKPPDHTQFLTDATDAQRQGFWRLPTVALHFVLTGEKDSLAAAAGFLKGFCALPHWESGKELDSGMGAANIMVGAALAFDWLYHDLEPDFREAMRQKLLLQARAMYHGGHLMRNRSATAYWQNDPQNNHRWHRDAGLALCALAVCNGGAEHDWILKRTSEELQYVRDWLPPDGTSHESPSYFIFGGSHLTLAMHAADRCLGTTYLDHPFFRNVGAFRLHTLTPGLKDAMPYGDCGGLGGYSSFLYKAAAHHRQADVHAGLRLLEQISPRAFEFTWFSLIWRDPSLKDGSLDNVARTAFYPDLGLALIRDGWKTENVAAMFKCGPYGGYKLNQYRNANDFRYVNVAHDDPDVNSFVFCARGAMLAETSRYSKKKLSSSHNTILVDGKGQLGDGQGWTQPLKGAHKDMTSLGVVTAWKDAGDVVIVEGEGAGAYAGLTRFRRTFLWVRPRYLLVLDDIRAGKDVAITWLLQGPQLSPLERARDHYLLAKDDVRCELAVIGDRPLAADIATSTADHQGKPLGWQQLRLTAPAGRALRVASVYDAWGLGKLALELKPAGPDAATVTLTAGDATDTWSWQSAAGERAPSKLTATRGEKVFVELKDADRPPKADGQP